MKVDVLTLFPEMFAGPLDESILRRARDSGRPDRRRERGGAPRARRGGGRRDALMKTGKTPTSETLPSETPSTTF